MHFSQVQQDLQQEEYHYLMNQKNLLKVSHFSEVIHSLVGGMSFIYLVITAFYPESKLQSMRGFISGRTLHMKELFLTITVIFAIYIVIVAFLLHIFGEDSILDIASLSMLDNFSLAMSTLSTGGFTPNIDNS